MTEAELVQATLHPSLHMYSPADLKQEFELVAQPFWREWDLFEHAISETPPNTPKLELAQRLLLTYGLGASEGILEELEGLLQLPSFNKFSKSLLTLMCNQAISGIAPEDILIQTRQAVESALLEYQKYFLTSKVFYPYVTFWENSRVVPETHIKVLDISNLLYIFSNCAWFRSMSYKF